MQIVDAQVHGNRLGPDWHSVPFDVTLDRVLAGMDALGIAAAILDEYVAVDVDGNVHPGSVHPDGHWRPKRPFSDLAVGRYPDRFAYVSRMDRRDPAMQRLTADFFTTPGLLGLRVHHGPGPVWADPDFADGGYNSFFAQAEQSGIPLFMYVAPRIDLLEPYARRFPNLKFVVDHFGATRAPKDEPPANRYARLDAVLTLSDCANVTVKWCHPERLAAEPYPFGDLLPHLRRVLDAFGADRIMWASDCTESAKAELSDHPSSWAESLFWVWGTDKLSTIEKEWILGRTVRTVLRWPMEVHHIAGRVR